MAVSKESVGSLLDDLLIESLYLIEEYTKSCILVETSNQKANLYIAQARFHQGYNAIRMTHVPTSEGGGFNALCTVNINENKQAFSGSETNLQLHPINQAEGYVQPLHWFSQLPSLTLKLATKQYKKSVQLITESVNIKRELISILDNINKLKSYLMSYDNDQQTT